MPLQPDYYAMLGLPRDASPEEIRRAYHQAALRLHPDVNVETGDTELFLDIQRAFEILADPDLRAKYDQQLPPVERERPPYDIHLLYSRNILPVINEPQLVYALINVSPPAGEESTDNSPLNVCLVIDRSTSMQGERMDTVKNTAIELVRQLRLGDILSIVTFSDRAEVIVPADRRADRTGIETKIQMIQTGGATEIFRGLEAGYEEIRANLQRKYINHIILLTDGRTYGDEAHCIRVADQAAARGIGISCLGIGEEWNDTFLDNLAARTGGTCAYIARSRDIRRFLKEKFTGLSRTYADNVRFDFHLGKDVELRYAFRLAPEIAPLETTSPILMGGIPNGGNLAVILEFLVPPIPSNANRIALATGQIVVDIPSLAPHTSVSRLRLFREVSNDPSPEPAPTGMLNALSRLNLYRIQERANQEIADGNPEGATQYLSNLATNLFAQGHVDLARAVMQESERIQRGQMVSEEGKKQIKYGTRSLLLPASADAFLPLEAYEEGEL
jgi:Ca-activated chloride channel family protein